MKSALKATAILGSASAVSVVGGLISSKVAALAVGPVGVGYLGLLQSLVGLGVVVAGMGIGAGLVRDGAKALAMDDPRQAAALRRGGWFLCLGLGATGALLMVLLRRPLSGLFLGTPDNGPAVAVMALAMLLSLAAAYQTSVLNAYRRVADLARCAMLTTFFGVTMAVALIWQLRHGGIVPAVLATSAASWAVSFYFMRTRVPATDETLSWPDLRDTAGRLLRFGIPYTASMMVGAGVLLIVPVLVLHVLGPTEVGFYRAAAAVSISYLGFLLTAMAQDYYPRVSAAADAEALRKLINDQLRIVLLLAGPLILAMLALVPLLIPLIYSSQFAPAEELLEWQLIGDLFKFSCWTMSFVILANLGSKAYFWTELLGGTLLVLTSWAGMHWLGLAGLGIAFLLTSAIVGLVSWIVLRRVLGLRWTLENKILFLTFAAAMAVVRALPYLGLSELRMPVALALALGLGSLSVYRIWDTFGGWQGLRTWLRRANPSPETPLT